MAINGSDVLLLVNTGTELVPAYEVVGCQRDVTFEETTEEIDVSCKDQREKRVLPGRYSASISLDALYVPSDDAYLALKAAKRNGELILVAREYDGATEETANALITSMSEAFPDQGEATISISLTIDGAWVEVSS
jgi:TP901-1 family phage major tail protein